MGRDAEDDRVTVYGVATPYAWEVVETLWRLGRQPVCVDNYGGADPALPGLCQDLADPGRDVVLGPSSAPARARAGQLARAAGAASLPPVVDASAVVARTARLAHGSYLNALVVVGAHTEVGCLVNLNRSTSVGHHCRLGPFTSTGPAATLCGHVTTGIGVFLGAGCVVLPGCSVGNGAIVGAGAVVTRDVPACAVVVGNPARVVRSAEWEGPASCPLC